MAAHPAQTAGEVKYGYVIVTATVDSQSNVTRLVQLPSFFHRWTSFNRLSERVQLACALKRGQRSVMLMPAVVFSPDVCFPESCHTGRVRRRPLIKPMNVRSSHSFDGFHIRI